MFVPLRDFQLSLMLASKDRAYPSGEPFRCSTPTNVRLGFRGLTGTSTLAYYMHLKIAAVKCLTIFGLMLGALQGPCTAPEVGLFNTRPT